MTSEPVTILTSATCLGSYQEFSKGTTDVWVSTDSTFRASAIDMRNGGFFDVQHCYCGLPQIGANVRTIGAIAAL
jgi:hypothetical protein